MFREIVNERGERLRKLSYAELDNFGSRPAEFVEVDGRQGSVAVIVLHPVPNTLQVVVQGFLRHRFLPGASVALDGFYKYRDGSVAPMQPQEFYGFD
jgi:hypothetical protein